MIQLVVLALVVALFLCRHLIAALVPLCRIGIHDWDMEFPDPKALNYVIECSHCKRRKS